MDLLLQLFMIIVKILNSKKKNYGYNAYDGTFTDMLEAGIIDPTKVTRSALQNAGSVASTLLTTECIITDNEKENKNK